MSRFKYKRLLLISLTFIMIFSIFCTKSNADSQAGISCPASVNVGSDLTVGLSLPQNAYAAEAVVTVKFSDGSTLSKKIAYVSGMSGFGSSVTFSKIGVTNSGANNKIAGTATVTVSNIIISDNSGKELEKGGSKVQNLNVVAAAQEQHTPTPQPTGNTNTTKPQQTEKPSVKFSDVSEVIYTTERCNIRESYSAESNKVGTVDKRTELKRTGVGDNGWSRVEYNGKTCYIISKYVTNEKLPDPEFKAVNKTQYSIQNCNVRESWNTTSNKVGYLEKGQEVTVVGVSAEIGWTKIKYNGKDAYVATRLLSDEEPEEEENTVDNTNVADVNEVVNPENELETIKKEIGVLPEVGKNIAVTIYIFVTIIVSTASLISYYYISKKKI